MPYELGALQQAAPRTFTTPSGVIQSRPGQDLYAKGKKPKKHPISDYLASDPDYKNTVNDLTRNFQAYKTQNVTNRGDLRQDYFDTRSRLGKEQKDASKDLAADFAARGLFGSGLSLNAGNEQNLKFQEQFGDAGTSFNRNLTQLLTDLANSKTLFQQQKEDAKLAAIRRRAEKLGIRS